MRLKIASKRTALNFNCGILTLVTEAAGRLIEIYHFQVRLNPLFARLRSPDENFVQMLARAPSTAVIVKTNSRIKHREKCENRRNSSRTVCVVGHRRERAFCLLVESNKTFAVDVAAGSCQFWARSAGQTKVRGDIESEILLMWED